MKNLRTLRKSVSMEQEPFAAQFGIKPTTWSSYEAGPVVPKLATLKAIADKYEVTLDFLLDFCDDPHGSKYGQSFSITLEEKNLVKAWREADEKDRRIIAATLEEYGFDYRENGLDSEGAS